MMLLAHCIGGAYSSTTGYNESDASANHPSGQISYEDSFAAQASHSSSHIFCVYLVLHFLFQDYDFRITDI